MTLLEQLRRERKWSQRDLAAHLEKTQAAVSKWEKGLMTPHPRTRKKLAALFNVEPVERLFARVEE